MNITYPENRYLVHFPENPTYWLNANSIENQMELM
ncbi:hypothetical protein I5F07_14420 [Proteus vulgaris]|nr:MULTISPECIES: hypothetical protein [Proteus]RNT22148.1 hypothetical protein B9475_016905 [Proteus mirabilis]AYY82802.1 hypothetical protein EGX81_18890 [Proteus vulgaris]MBG5971487.1 hypothetical protein [Proteus vulgaris]MBG5986049.1 hypothetical protein [Proteus vulgaris]MBI6511985.1 hypothetical protein [Proteus sp. PR00174]